LVRKRRPVVLQRLAEAGFQGRLHEPTPRHPHQARHDARGLCEIDGGGDTRRVLAEAPPTLGLALPFGALHECRGRQQRGVQRMGREDDTTGLINEGGTPGEASGEGAVERVDHGRRLTAGAGVPPCAVT
jgi:hypothetical protein